MNESYHTSYQEEEEPKSNAADIDEDMAEMPRASVHTHNTSHSNNQIPQYRSAGCPKVALARQSDRECQRFPNIAVRHESFICVTCLIHMCDMSYSYV